MEKAFKQHPTQLVKVVLYGPESTGKTTLSKQLAAYYNTQWVPEYARTYLQKKWEREHEICEESDLLPIAAGQIKLENLLAKKAKKVLICDTNLLETKVYSEVYYNNSCHPLLKKYALKNKYNLYFLTYIDVPWEADDLRDKPGERIEMFNAFKEALIKNNCPFVVLKGTKEERFKQAITEINNLLQLNI